MPPTILMEQFLKIARISVSRRFSQIEDADFRRISLNLRLQSANLREILFLEIILLSPFETVNTVVPKSKIVNLAL